MAQVKQYRIMASQEKVEIICQEDIYCEHLQLCDELSVKINQLTEKKGAVTKELENVEAILNECEDFINEYADRQTSTIYQLIESEFETRFDQQIDLNQDYLNIQAEIDGLNDKMRKCQNEAQDSDCFCNI